jgi:hypothetical protein
MGRFVAFSEMLTDFTPKPLIDKTPVIRPTEARVRDRRCSGKNA